MNANNSPESGQLPFRNVIVTGGAGCIGLEVCQELQRRGCGVHLFDLSEQILRAKEAIPKRIDVYYGSILDQSSIREAMEGCDAVIHLAGYLGVRRTEINKLRCLEINVEGTKNILERAVQHQLKKIVFASSSEVYGEPKENPIHEDAPTQGKTVYAVSKLMGEELCRAYTQRYPRLQHVILRYFNTYGPYQTAQFVITRFIYNVLHDKPPVINGDGKQRRSYCYASDTAWATVEALFRPEANNETINIGNKGNMLTLEELAHRVIELAGKKNKIIPVFASDFGNADRERSREIFERYCDTSKAQTLLDFQPKVSLDEGIQKIIGSRSIFEKWETTELPY